MDLEAALRARLTAAPAVTALAGTRISWDLRPQATALPAVTMTIIDAPLRQHMGGVEETQRALVQVDVWALKSTERRLLRDAVTDALIPAAEAAGIKFQRGFREGSRGGGEDSTAGFVFRQRMDFRFTYSEA